MHPTWEHPSVRFLFLPPGMSFSVCVNCIIRNKLQTFILGIQHFRFKNVHFFPIICSCTGLTLCRLFVLLRNRKHCRTPQQHSLKTSQQHFKRRQKWDQHVLFSSIVFNCTQDIVEKPGFLTLFHRKVKAYFPHIQLKHFGRQFDKIH